MFNRLLDITLPHRGYLVAMVEAYFDESGTDAGSPFLTVAGYIFEKERAVALGVEWSAMLARYGLPYFHMVEAAHNTGIFRHLSREECDLAAREAIALTKKHATKGIAVSLDKNCYGLIPPDGLFSNPYAFVAGQVFHGVKKWADEVGYEGKVAYFFEGGADGWSGADGAMQRMAKNEWAKREFRWGSHSFIAKEDAVPLQCADMLAWHWLTYNKRIQRGETKLRKDFQNLIGLRIDPHHYDEKAVTHWLAIKRETDHREWLTRAKDMALEHRAFYVTLCEDFVLTDGTVVIPKEQGLANVAAYDDLLRTINVRLEALEVAPASEPL